MATNTVLNTQPQLIKDALVEAHYFTQGSNPRYIVGGVIKDFEFNADKVLINHSAVLNSYNIQRGTFDVAINVYNNLLGSYQLKSTSGDFQGLVANLIQKITNDPKQTTQSFQTILTNASKLALDPESEPSRDPQPGQTAGNNTAPFKVTNNIATAGNMELNLSDPQQRQIYDRIRDEVAKGDIKV